MGATADWALGEDFGPDRLSMHTHLSIQPHTPGPTLGLAWSKTNWDKFSTTMDEERLDFGSLHSPQIEKAADSYARTLHMAIGKAVTRINPAEPRRMRGWWNRELDEISQTVNQLLAEAHQEPANQEKATAARKARNARRNAIRAATQSY